MSFESKGKRKRNEMTFAKAQKIFIGIAIIVVIGISVGGCQEQPEKYTGPLDKLTVAAYAGDTGALVYIAQEQGYFVDNGLDVVITDYEAGKLAADALLAGEADISTSADFVLVSNSFEHDNLRIPGTIALANSVELVTRKDTGINQPSDLKEGNQCLPGTSSTILPSESGHSKVWNGRLKSGGQPLMLFRI